MVSFILTEDAVFGKTKSRKAELAGGEAGTGTAPENAGNRRRKVFLELWHVQQGGTMPCDVLPLALVCFFCYNKKHVFHVVDFAGNGKKE